MKCKLSVVVELNQGYGDAPKGRSCAAEEFYQLLIDKWVGLSIFDFLSVSLGKVCG